MSECGQRASFNGADGISDIEGKATRVGASERGQRGSFNSDETEAGVCAAAALHAISAAAHPERWSLAHPALAPATWLLARLPARVPRRACS
jgi:hypothetical protein